MPAKSRDAENCPRSSSTRTRATGRKLSFKILNLIRRVEVQRTLTPSVLSSHPGPQPSDIQEALRLRWGDPSVAPRTSHAMRAHFHEVSDIVTLQAGAALVIPNRALVNRLKYVIVSFLHKFVITYLCFIIPKKMAFMPIFHKRRKFNKSIIVISQTSSPLSLNAKGYNV